MNKQDRDKRHDAKRAEEPTRKLDTRNDKLLSGYRVLRIAKLESDNLDWLIHNGTEGP